MINFLLRKIHFDQQTVKTITVPSISIAFQNCRLASRRFRGGARGLLQVWLEAQRLALPSLARGRRSLVELAQQNPSPNPVRRRALDQAARELMLAQSSDWAFIMKTGTMVEYACERTRVHVLNFNHLYEQVKRDELDEPWLSEIERRHNLFPDMDYRLYA